MRPHILTTPLALRAVLVCLAVGACRETSSRDNPAQTALETQLTEELRIDGMAADLVPTRSLAVAVDGTIAILQDQDHAVRFFSATGESLGSVGREGEGPGEFAQLNRLGWLADSLWVLDGRLSRLTIISPAREFVRTEIAPRQTRSTSPGMTAPDAWAFIIPFAWLPDHSLITYASKSDRDAILRLALDGSFGRVVTPLSSLDEMRTIRLSGGGTAGPPFSTTARVGVSPDGRFVAVARARFDDAQDRSFSFTLISPEGDTVFSRRHPFTAESIAQSVADSMIERITTRFSSENAALYRRQVTMPDVYPPIVDIVISTDGTSWIRMRDQGGARPYLALDSAGEVLYKVTVPRNTIVVAASRTMLWTLESDENDIQSIVRYRVNKP